MKSTLFVIIATNKYQKFAAVAKKSLQKHTPGALCTIIEPKLEESSTSPLYPTDIQNVLAMRPKTILEALSGRWKTIVLLGADMYFKGDISSVIERYQDASIAACPHNIELPDDPARASWVNLTGLYNSDFVIYNHHPDTFKFLQWQHNMLETHCVNDPNKGVFFDQSFLQHAALLSTFKPITEPGVNVAWYNLYQDLRPLTTEQGLLAFQFSGYDPDRPARLSKYDPNANIQSIETSLLCLEYYEQLQEVTD